MKGDFSRITFDPANHFSRVLMQQGRVLVDADWNELNDVLVHDLRGLATDLIGPHGGPAYALPNRQAYVGFEIAPTAEDIAVYGGRYYVDGLLCDLPELFDGNGQRRPATTYKHQPYSPGTGLPEGPPYLVYLDVWERHVTALEQTLIRDVALGGPDTCSRAQVVWQIKLLVGAWLRPFLRRASCATFPLGDFRRELRGNPALLKARAKRPVPSDNEPCLTPPGARYRRNENQLYRVEIHKVSEGGTLPATFKWSRENGSVVVPWLDRRGNDLVVTGVRDDKRGFSAGDWVELVGDDLELAGQPGVMVKVNRVEGEVLTVDSPTAGQVIPDPKNLRNPKVRRWDQRGTPGSPLGPNGGAVPVGEGTTEDYWISLEDGIAVQFQPAGNGEAPHRYRTGDYWLIPARVATGDVEWPGAGSDDPLPVEPHGIRHHYAPLLLVTGGAPVDLRKAWTPLGRCSPWRL